MKVKERAKELFQRYCELRGYRCCVIPTSQKGGVRTPDFEVFANDVTIVAETKDLTANPEDIRLWRETRKGEIVVHGHEPGKRARDVIEDARGQLRVYAQAGVPSIVVLYDNIVVDGIRVDPLLFSPLSMTDIDVALYGLWQANLRIHPSFKVESLGDSRSRYRRIWHDREIFSAVIVLNDYPNGDKLYTVTYHNYWASKPLPRNVFDGEDDFHFVKTTNPDIQPNKWVRI